MASEAFKFLNQRTWEGIVQFIVVPMNGDPPEPLPNDARPLRTLQDFFKVPPWIALCDYKMELQREMYFITDKSNVDDCGKVTIDTDSGSFFWKRYYLKYLYEGNQRLGYWCRMKFWGQNMNMGVFPWLLEVYASFNPNHRTIICKVVYKGVAIYNPPIDQSLDGNTGNPSYAPSNDGRRTDLGNGVGEGEYNSDNNGGGDLRNDRELEDNLVVVASNIDLPNPIPVSHHLGHGGSSDGVGYLNPLDPNYYHDGVTTSRAHLPDDALNLSTENMIGFSFYEQNLGFGGGGAGLIVDSGVGGASTSGPTQAGQDLRNPSHFLLTDEDETGFGGREVDPEWLQCISYEEILNGEMEFDEGIPSVAPRNCGLNVDGGDGTVGGQCGLNVDEGSGIVGEEVEAGEGHPSSNPLSMAGPSIEGGSNPPNPSSLNVNGGSGSAIGGNAQAEEEELPWFWWEDEDRVGCSGEVDEGWVQTNNDFDFESLAGSSGEAADQELLLNDEVPAGSGGPGENRLQQ